MAPVALQRHEVKLSGWWFENTVKWTTERSQFTLTSSTQLNSTQASLTRFQFGGQPEIAAKYASKLASWRRRKKEIIYFHVRPSLFVNSLHVVVVVVAIYVVELISTMLMLSQQQSQKLYNWARLEQSSQVVVVVGVTGASKSPLALWQLAYDGRDLRVYLLASAAAS